MTLERIRNSRLGRRYIGDHAFYALVLGLLVPIVIQNIISNFVSLLDNIMVGAVSTEEMNGVSISNQLIFVFNLCVFGGMSGATIFAAQFYGAKNEDGVRDSFRYTILLAVGLSAIAIAVLAGFSRPLIGYYINDVEAVGGAEDTLKAGMGYVRIMLFGLFPFAMSQAYAGTLRVTGETKLPMAASVTSVLVNLVGNYILIFGHLGAPALGACGAAVATVISRYVEMLIIVVVAHRRNRRDGTYGFLSHAYSHFHIPGWLAKRITVKGMPLLVNELLWSVAVALLAQLYSLRGLNVVAANTITSTITNLFNVFFLSMGTAASVLVGRKLGERNDESSRACARQIIAFDIVICVVVAAVMFAVAPLLPQIYRKATVDARRLAVAMIRICACSAPLSAFANCSYFILRSGGRTGITFLFDSGYSWIIQIPLVYSLVHFTDLGILYVFGACHAAELIKDIFGYILMKKGVWIRNIVSEPEPEVAYEKAEAE